MPCECCERARSFLDYRMFSPACLHCGARIIQLLGRMPIAQSECTRRRRENLADWVAWGHSEAEIRRLVKGPLAIAPEPEQPKKAKGRA